ncbi:MAG: DUF72 domain-containing protein [Cytophagales bacterium]|nr:DUF72 domain-containing protein [Cytophagales bacterium]MDW8383222.1 DUF72 domain-containing protein [Flammeovirgaceae bacterium]
MEFRHREWFSNSLAAWETLIEYQVSTVITDVAGRRDVLHKRLITPYVIIRFVGNQLHPTDIQRLHAWAERLAY